MILAQDELAKSAGELGDELKKNADSITAELKKNVESISTAVVTQMTQAITAATPYIVCGSLAALSAEGWVGGSRWSQDSI
jgi:ElaB/YqjD/DUF883 family membrane-anchored ribosome-binding protein